MIFFRYKIAEQPKPTSGLPSPTGVTYDKQTNINVNWVGFEIMIQTVNALF